MNHRSRVAEALALVAAIATVAGLPPPAAAEREIVIETPGERSTQNKLLLAGLAAGAGIAGGLGLYWHLDSRSAADEVSADLFTGEAWTAEDQALVDQADRSRTRAIVAYGVGGALLVGAVVALIVTEPPTEIVVIRPSAAPTIAPTEGGAVLGGWWSF